MAQYIQNFISGKPFGDGADGAYSSSGNATDDPIDSSCSGTSGTTSLSATNASFAAGQIILIHQSRGTGAGNWEINKIASYTAGTITTSANLSYTYTDSGASQAQVLVVKRYSSFTQNNGHTLTAKAWDGNVGGIIAFACNGTTSIVGTISTDGKGYLGATLTITDGHTCGQGEGTSGARDTQSNNANGNGGGGAIVVSGTKPGGGGGGFGTVGSQGGNGAGTGGQGGSAVGVASLTSLFFGGSGGAGGNDGTGGGATMGVHGGGIIVIFSKTVDITGLLRSNAGANTSAGGSSNGGGGGGAGGSLLIKAGTATLGTSNTATGSGGNPGNGSGVNGGAGGNGRIHLDYNSSYTGTTNPTLDATLDTSLVESSGAFLPFF